ncbi:MAG: cation:proton antiporter [Deltaproteobacteria bacterium]|nr:cation:proton antiporter [Deltaproteobacteria bacterium]
MPDAHLTETLLVGLTLILAIGVAAQLLAWRLRIPSILILLLVAFAVGPLSGLIDPDAMLGNLLFPIVSLSVAIILFEGGLNLRLSELEQIGTVVRNLITIGAFVTLLVGCAGAHFLLGMEWPLAVLLGAILTVTGPTVIIPMLASLHARRLPSLVLKWEGITIDPIGATLAVLVFESILAADAARGSMIVLLGLAGTVIAGAFCGLAASYLLIHALKRFWIPDFLQIPIALGAVLAAFAASNSIQPESGLLAVTLMGIVLANQRDVYIRHIIEFKETLRVLLISVLFIVLGARVRLEHLTEVGWAGAAFLALMIFVARPLSVWLSTLRSGLGFPEKALLAWMAPRGIVAAAVSAVFGLYLTRAGYPGAEKLVPYTLLIVVGTVAFYGLTTPIIARYLGVSQPDPQGLLIVGAHDWTRQIASVLQTEGFFVLLVDTNWANVNAAKMEGLPAYFGNILQTHTIEEIELHGVGSLLAMTSNDEINALACMNMVRHFGQAKIYQMADDGDEPESAKAHIQGRVLFGKGVTYAQLQHRFDAGARVKKTPLTEEYGYDDFLAQYGRSALPLFLVRDEEQLVVLTADTAEKPEPGDTVVALVDGETTAGEPTPPSASD